MDKWGDWEGKNDKYVIIRRDETEAVSVMGGFKVLW